MARAAAGSQKAVVSAAFPAFAGSIRLQKGAWTGPKVRPGLLSDNAPAVQARSRTKPPDPADSPAAGELRPGPKGGCLCLMMPAGEAAHAASAPLCPQNADLCA